MTIAATPVERSTSARRACPEPKGGAKSIVAADALRLSESALRSRVMAVCSKPGATDRPNLCMFLFRHSVACTTSCAAGESHVQVSIWTDVRNATGISVYAGHLTSGRM